MGEAVGRGVVGRGGATGRGGGGRRRPWECAAWNPGDSNDEGTREAAYGALARFDPETLVAPPGGDESPADATPPVPADELATAYLTDPAPTTSGTIRAAAAVVERVARLERNRAARSTLAPGGGSLLGGSVGDDARRAKRDGGRIAASSDPLLHRLLNTAPRRLRTMPRLDGAAKGTDGDVGNRCGPAGPRAHLLLFRPPPRRSDDEDDLDDDDRNEDAAGDERRRKPGRRAMEVIAELRDVAEAHRRAFVTVASALREPPRAHWWHAATAVKSWSRFVRRWRARRVRGARERRGIGRHRRGGGGRVRRAGLHGDADGRRVGAGREEQRGDGAFVTRAPRLF